MFTNFWKKLKKTQNIKSFLKGYSESEKFNFMADFFGDGSLTAY